VSLNKPARDVTSLSDAPSVHHLINVWQYVLMKPFTMKFVVALISVTSVWSNSVGFCSGYWPCRV